MLDIPFKNSFVRTSFAIAAIVSLFAVTSAFAQTAPKNYEVELVVTEGKKSVETDAVLSIKEETVRVEPDKQSFKSSAKEFSY